MSVPQLAPAEKDQQQTVMGGGSAAKKLKVNNQSVAASSSSGRVPMINSNSIESINVDVLKMQNKKLSEAVQHYRVVQERTSNQKESLNNENDQLRAKIAHLEQTMSILHSTVQNLAAFSEQHFPQSAGSLLTSIDDVAEEVDLDAKINNHTEQRAPPTGDLIHVSSQYRAFAADRSPSFAHTHAAAESVDFEHTSLQVKLQDIVLRMVANCDVVRRADQATVKDMLKSVASTTNTNEQLTTCSACAPQLQTQQQKIASLQSIVRQLEGDVEFKEQKIIKCENLLAENEAMVDQLNLELETARNQSQINNVSSNGNVGTNSSENDPGASGIIVAGQSLEKDDAVAQLEATLKAKSQLIEKYQGDLSHLENLNHQLQKTITQHEDAKEFASIEELGTNHVYQSVRHSFDAFIDEKQTMEKFLVAAVRSSGEAHLKLSEKAAEIRSEYKDIHTVVLEKNIKLEERIEQLSEELMIVTQDYEMMLIATDQIKGQMEETNNLMQKLIVQKKQLESENHRLKFEIEQSKKDVIPNEITESLGPNQTLADYDAKSFAKYLDSLGKVVSIKNGQVKDLPKQQKDPYCELTLHLKQAIEKMRLYLKVNLVQNAHVKNLKILENAKIVELKKKEEMLLKELEVTGSALEDLQQQSTDLLEKLKQKDEANFKIITEFQQVENVVKMKTDQFSEVSHLNDSLKIELKLQSDVIRKGEEQIDQLNNQLVLLDQQIKRIVNQEIEANQCVKAVQLEKSELHGEIKSITVSSELQRSNLLQLENTILEERGVKRKLIAQIRSLQTQLAAALGKSTNPAASAGELAAVAEDIPLLLEEIREYKQKLTCPCCNYRRKNAILMRCLHVFCMECLTIRFETRQRKCPKCNANFGPNDFKKIYLE